MHAPSPAPASPAVPPAVAFSRTLAVTSLLGLILLGLAWELWLAPLRPGGSWIALKVLPLCVPLAGLLRHRMYTYRWVSLLVWLYFTEGVVRAWSDRPPSSWLAAIEILLCLFLFAACTLHVRARLGKRLPHEPLDHRTAIHRGRAPRPPRGRPHGLRDGLA